MRFIIQVRIEHLDPESGGGDGHVVDVAVLEREGVSMGTLGLRIDDAKALLAGVQDTVIAEQCASALAAADRCSDCGRPFAHKESRRIVVRSLYGRVGIVSPRWWTCPCDSSSRRSFTPLAALLPCRSTPELGLVEAKLAAHMSYDATRRLLGELFPVGRRIDGTEARRHVYSISERLDTEIAATGDEAPIVTIDVMQSLPVPDMPLVVTIDGGYVHSSEQTRRSDGWFQAVCGTVTRHDGTVRRFGFVPNIDDHARRRIHDMLVAQGLQPNQLVTFLSDGADDLAKWTARQNPTAEYVLDWFHLTMRFTVLLNTMKSLRDDPDDEDVCGITETLRADVTSAKWHLWHGNMHRANELLEDTALGLAACADNEARTKAAKFLDELRRYVHNNRATIPNYAERHQAGEPISSATAEATVNHVITRRMVKHQQMRWSPTGAHHILQIRTRTLDGQLDHDIKRWHPTAA